MKLTLNNSRKILSFIILIVSIFSFFYIWFKLGFSSMIFSTDDVLQNLSTNMWLSLVVSISILSLLNLTTKIFEEADKFVDYVWIYWSILSLSLLCFSVHNYVEKLEYCGVFFSDTQKMKSYSELKLWEKKLFLDTCKLKDRDIRFNNL